MSMFSLSPGSRFNRKEIKEKTRLNNVPLDKALLRLVSSGILKRDGNLYYLDFENNSTKTILEICSKQYRVLKELPFDVYLILVDLVSELSLYKEIEAYIFGSYSKLIYDEKSDIDIAILATKKTDKERLQKAVQKLEKLYVKGIETHFFDKRRFYKNKKDPLVKEIIKNGALIIRN